MNSSFSQERYQQNLELLVERNPLAAYRLEWVWDSHELTPCLTDQGEPNLSKTRYGMTDYYHAQTGALQEAVEGVKPELLSTAEVIYVYGLGLGYGYQALLPWLQEKPQNHLVFLEDDLEVIYYFLQTELATSLLKNPQVTLFYFHDYQQDYVNFCKLNSSFINKRIDFLALPHYAIRREAEALTLCYAMLHDAKLMTALHNEYLSGQSGFLKNFYHNLLSLPQAYLASGLFNQFKNVPAIICGAGPSLQKNIHLLKELGQKGLIFAGGSSLNVLNEAGIMPHFGLGVDPNKEQSHRLLTNHTFHLPFLYRQRISHEAFELMQGPKLYVPGSANRLSSWFEERLGMPEEPLDEGHNVVNLCTEIAYKMGCSPIIYVGMDLAFTEVQTYAPGIATHPLWIELSQPYATQAQEVVLRPDIYNEWIKTKWEWVAEAGWLGQFAKNHPKIQMINATEGGLGFAPVPNQTLANVKEEYLARSYDLSGWVHAEIQSHPLEIKQPALLSLINELKTSLDKCLAACNSILVEKATQKQFSPSPIETLEFYTPNTIVQDSAMKEEIGYKHFLEMFDMAYQYLQSSQHMTHTQPATLFFDHLERYHFLQETLSQNLALMQQAIQRFIFAPPPMALKKYERLVPKEPGEVYAFADGLLQIKDPILDLSIDEPFAPDPAKDHFKKFFPNGQIKFEMYYLHQQLHGPSRFYHENGQLLSQSWFYRDKKLGKSLQYYKTGALYSLCRYRDGLLDGTQEYFYSNGSPHIVMQYKEGLLEGKVCVYTIEGQLLRELHYKAGKRHGTEKMWSTHGQQLMECHYQEGIPVGQAKQWDAKGHLFKEVDIHAFPEDFDLTIWNEQGQCVKSFVNGVEDYSQLYEQTQQKVDLLETALKDILIQMEPIVQEHLTQAKEVDLNLAEEFATIKEAMKNMQALKDNLAETMQKNIEQAEEAKRKRQSSEPS